MSLDLSYPSRATPPEYDAVRQSVREFLAQASQQWSGWELGHSWMGFDREFSCELGRRGWIGMTWPNLDY